MPGTTVALKRPFASEVVRVDVGPLISIDAPATGAPPPLRTVPLITADVAAGALEALGAGIVCAPADVEIAAIDTTRAVNDRRPRRKQRLIMVSFSGEGAKAMRKRGGSNRSPLCRTLTCDKGDGL